MKKIVTNINKHLYLSEEEISLEDYSSKWEWNIVRLYDTKNQKWYGVGGSFTESSCYNISKLSERTQKQLLNDYFSSDGLNYSLGRLTIGSCDFSLDSYSYSYKDDLSDFSIEKDKEYILPILKRALEVKNLSLLASPWSPPVFMKDNGSLYKGGKLKREYYDLYAQYLRKYLDAYRKEGVEVDYLTMQNEPYATQRWESCNFSLPEQKEFIYNHLVDALYDYNTKILLWDHNKENLPYVVSELVGDNDKIAGVAMHWYVGSHFKHVEMVREKYPDYLIFHTEGCRAYTKYNEEEWMRDAELYLIDLIGDVCSGANGYIDWNLVLDSKGGPNHKDNFCKSPIMLTKNGRDYIKTPIYYYLGHISKYVPVGATILDMDLYRPDLFGCAFRKDDEYYIVLLNVQDYEIEVNVVMGEKMIHDFLAPHTIVTYSTN